MAELPAAFAAIPGELVDRVGPFGQETFFDQVEDLFDWSRDELIGPVPAAIAAPAVGRLLGHKLAEGVIREAFTANVIAVIHGWRES